MVLIPQGPRAHSIKAWYFVCEFNKTNYLQKFNHSFFSEDVKVSPSPTLTQSISGHRLGITIYDKCPALWVDKHFRAPYLIRSHLRYCTSFYTVGDICSLVLLFYVSPELHEQVMAHKTIHGLYTQITGPATNKCPLISYRYAMSVP